MPQTVAPRTLHVPERALAYQPGDGRADRMIATAQQAARQTPDSIEAYDRLGMLFLRRYRETSDAEHLRRAEDAVHAALDRNAEDPLALSVSGLLAMQSHRFAEAVVVADRILRINDGDTTAYLLRGDALLELGNYPEAVAAYQRATDLRPDLRTYNRGAYVRWLHGDAQGSLELLQMAVDAGSLNDPESTAWCYVDVATVHWHLGNLVQTREALRQALALVPNYPPALRLRAQLEVAEGHSDAAIATLEVTLARIESVHDLLFLAEVLKTAGRAQDAQTRLARAEVLRREDTRALAAYWARHGDRTSEAVAAMAADLQQRSDIYSHAVAAIALARAGRAPEARAAMDRALALGTPDVTFFLYDALVHHLAGQRVEAQAALTRAAVNRAADPWLREQLERELGGSAGAAEHRGSPE